MKKIILLSTCFAIFTLSAFAQLNQFARLANPETINVNDIAKLNNTVYLATEAGLMSSTNDGNSWSLISPPSNPPLISGDVKVENVYEFGGDIYANYYSSSSTQRLNGSTWQPVGNTFVKKDRSLYAVLYDFVPNPQFKVTCVSHGGNIQQPSVIDSFSASGLDFYYTVTGLSNYYGVRGSNRLVLSRNGSPFFDVDTLGLSFGWGDVEDIVDLNSCLIISAYDMFGRINFYRKDLAANTPWQNITSAIGNNALFVAASDYGFNRTGIYGINTSQKIFTLFSPDSGLTFQPINISGLRRTASFKTVPANAANTVIAAGIDGPYVIDNVGATKKTAGLNNLNANHASVLNNTMFVNTGEVFLTSTDGQNFTQVPDTARIFFGTIGNDGSALYTPDFFGGLSKSTDAINLSRVSLPRNSLFVNDFKVAGNKLFISNEQDSVYISNNGGNTWANITDEVDSYGIDITAAISNNNNFVVIPCRDNNGTFTVFLSRNGGIIYSVMPSAQVGFDETTRFMLTDNDLVYATGVGVNGPYIFIYDLTGGSAWTIPTAGGVTASINPGLIGKAKMSGNRELVFAVDASSNLVYYSTDTGNTFATVTRPTPSYVEILSYVVFNDNLYLFTDAHGILVGSIVNGGLKFFNQTDLGLKAYPNPAKELLHFDANSLSDGDVLMLRDIKGKLLKEVVYSEGNKTLNTAELSPGFYTLTLYGKEGSQSIKIVK